MTEHSQTAGAHDTPPSTIPKEEIVSQPLFDFEQSLTPEEREMFFEYKAIFDLLNAVLTNTIKHEINFEKEIIKIAEIFHRLNVPIDGIMKEFREKHTADGLANIYRLERITGDDSSTTITELEKKCRDKLGQSRYFPTVWGSPEYEGVELVATVIDWKLKNRDFLGAQELVLRIPLPGQNIDLISQAFTNRDYFSEEYRKLACALIDAGLSPLQSIESCDARQVRTILTSTVQGYLEKGDLEQAQLVCEIQKRWCSNLYAGMSSATIQYDGIARTLDTTELYIVQEDARKFFYEQYALLRSVHALALAKHEKGIDFSDEVSQSMEIIRDIDDQVRARNYEGKTALAYCAYDAVVTYARLGIEGEPLNDALGTLKKFKDEFYSNSKTPYCAIAYATVGDFEGAQKNFFYNQTISGTLLPIPSGIRLAAEMAFECGQEETGQQLAALLWKICNEQQTSDLKAEYNSVAISFMKEHLRTQRFIAQREGRPYLFPAADYEDMVEYDVNNERHNDKAEDCALEHISGVLSDIGSWHPSLSDDQKEKVRSGAVTALQKNQKDDIVISSLTKLQRPLREEAHLWRFVRLTGVTLDPALVQGAYGKIFEIWSRSIDIEAMLKVIKDIQNSTDVLFDKKQHTSALENIYRTVLLNIGEFDSYPGPEYYLDRVKTLVDFTNIPVLPQILSETFKRVLVKRSDGAILWLLLDSFKNTPLVWDEIDPRADSEIYESTRKMPSNDLQKKMWGILADIGACIPREFYSKGWPGDFDRSHYPSIPPYIYGVWVGMFNHGMPVISDWFLKAVNDAYEKIGIDIGKKKPGTRAVFDRLTYGIVESQHLDCGMRRFLADLDGFVDRGISPKELADLVYSYALVSQLYVSMNLAGLSPSDEIREGRDEKKEFTGSVSEYIGQLERQASKLFGEIIGIPDLLYEQVMRLKEEWGSFDVLLTLAGKYAKGYEDGLPLFRDMLRAKIEDRWHEFRYNESDPIVARQFEGCTEEEKTGWIDNGQAQKLSDISLEAINTKEIAEGIHRHLQIASWGHHICPLEYEGSKEYLFEKTVQHLLTTNGLQTHNVPAMKNAVRSLIYEKKTLPDILKKLGVMSGVHEEGFDEELSSALEHNITLLSAVDPKTLPPSQRTLLKYLNIARDWFATSLAQKTANLDTLGISDAVPLKDLDEIYKALETTELLLRLSMISAKDIENGELCPFVFDAGRPDPLAPSIEKLVKIFEVRGSPFVQDLKNIQALLSQRFAVGSVEHLDLTIRESDDLKESLESGKYPIGASSCQNYESEVYYTKCLLARAGDADKKNLIIQKDDGTIVVENELKLVYIEDKSPAIFIEPTTYSGIKKRYDVTSDVEWYVKAKAQRMGPRIKVFRGADQGETGAIQVTVRPSRNHYQYEDGKYGGPGHGGLGIQEGEYTMWAVEVA